MTRTSISPFAGHAEKLRPRIDAAREARTRQGDECPARLGEAIEYSLLAPGKRLRPMLVLMAAEACGGDIDKAMPAACAIEMVHTYSLVHDDLPAMDDDDLRRGRPTCHVVFGEAVAILVGDALLTMALEILAKEIRSRTLAAACCAALSEAAGPCGLVGGQADDIAGVNVHSTIADLESIHRRKTGSMIRVSLRLGGLVGGADPSQLDALDQYGARLGLAFQIIDDLLDVFSDEQATGKRVGKDAEQGKLTFPGLLGLPESKARAEVLIGEACEAIAPLGPRAEGLQSLAQYVLERNR